MVEVKVTCKRCGSDDINSCDTVLSFATISGWETNEDGGLIARYSGDSKVDWDLQRPYDGCHPYVCGGCDCLLGYDDLIIEPADETPAP